MKITLTLICTCFLIGITQAQETITFIGKIEKVGYISKKERYETKGKFENAEITIIKDDQVVEQISSTNKGEFALVLEPDYLYNILFTSKAYVSKRIQVDTRNISVMFLKEDKKIFTDIRLFERIAGVDFSGYEKLPVAKCSYNKNFNRMLWDMTFASETYSTFLRLVNSRHLNQSQLTNLTSKPTSRDTVTEEESDYTEDSEWLDNYLDEILAKLK